MPIDLAFDSDQMAPLLVAAAEHSFKSSGMFGEAATFPWTIGIDEANQHAMLEGNTVVSQPSIVPQAVGLLFLDHALEKLLLSQNFDPVQGVVSLEPLIDTLEGIAHEPRNVFRAPLTLGS